MMWISLILGLLQAIPTIIDLVQKIVALIHGHPAQALHEHAFLGVLAAWHDHKDPAKVTADFEALHAKLTA